MILLRYTMIGLLIAALLIFGAKVVLNFILHRDSDYYQVHQKEDNLEPELNSYRLQTNSYLPPQGDFKEEKGEKAENELNEKRGGGKND